MTYRDRREAHAKQLREWADRRESKQDALWQAARTDEATTGIPFGQPILVGHHSERRHRNAIAKMDRAMGAAVENSRKAESMNSRADEIERQAAGAIYSDDVDAVERLRVKLEGLEAERAEIKRLNAAARKGTLTDEERLILARANRHAPIPGKGGGYPAYHLAKLSGAISTTRKRLAELEAPERGRWLEARYPGECRSCHEPIGKGDRALYFKRVRELECQPCGLGDGGTGAR
jgi:hypothetical protein